MSEIRHGCDGCVDAGYSNCGDTTCEYLRNHARVRPVPAIPGGGCVLYAKTYDQQAELEREHYWDQARALDLLAEGKSVDEVAALVGASICAIGALMNGYILPEPDPAPLQAPVNWDREEEYLKLYHAGVNDRGAAFAMGVSPQTIGNYRRRLGLPMVPRTKKRGE